MTPAMTQETITFSLDSETRQALDIIAEQRQQGRAEVLQDAVKVFLDLYQWQVAHIEAGLRQAEAGEFASDAEVAAAFQI